jgi:hypothetical protein
VDSDIETEPFEPKVPMKYLEDMIDANAPRRGSLEVIPNVTHINKLLQSEIAISITVGFELLLISLIFKKFVFRVR